MFLLTFYCDLHGEADCCWKRFVSASCVNVAERRWCTNKTAAGENRQANGRKKSKTHDQVGAKVTDRRIEKGLRAEPSDRQRDSDVQTYVERQTDRQKQSQADRQ